MSVIQLPVVVRIRVDGEKEKTGFRSAARVAGFNWMLYLDDLTCRTVVRPSAIGPSFCRITKGPISGCTQLHTTIIPCLG